MKFVYLFVCLVAAARSANILAVVPTLSSSHYVVLEALIKGLLKRGHTVTTVTTFPQKTPIANLTDIDVSSNRIVFKSNLKVEFFPVIPETFFSVTHRFFDYLSDVERILSVPEVEALINSKVTFDLIIYETFIDDVFLGFAHKFRTPVVTIGTSYMFPWVVDRFGIPANPAYIPGFYSGYSGTLNFYQRVENTFLDLTCRLFYNFRLEPRMTEAVKKFFRDDTPPVRDLVKNISLYLVNTHSSIFGARPFPPQVVDVAGIHLTLPKPLHADLERWMNESADGVVYFSFGSMLRGATLPEDKVRAFIEVFRTLPQRVLWKWEDDSVAGLPDNVKLMKWLPQRDVLAHPKVKVFISHGGLLGTTEAVVSGVPILGIPMYGDQPNNVAALVENKVAIHVDYNNISVASLSYALNTLINDKSFSENAKKLSQRFLDRPQSPLDTAVYWTEYVIRHGGAPHLQSAAVHLTWYQYYLLDVIAVCLAAVAAIVATLVYIIKTSLRLICAVKTTKLKSN